MAHLRYVCEFKYQFVRMFAILSAPYLASSNKKVRLERDTLINSSVENYDRGGAFIRLATGKSRF